MLLRQKVKGLSHSLASSVDDRVFWMPTPFMMGSAFFFFSPCCSVSSLCSWGGASQEGRQPLSDRWADGDLNMSCLLSVVALRYGHGHAQVHGDPHIHPSVFHWRCRGHGSQHESCPKSSQVTSLQFLSFLHCTSSLGYSSTFPRCRSGTLRSDTLRSGPIFQCRCRCRCR